MAMPMTLPFGLSVLWGAGLFSRESDVERFDTDLLSGLPSSSLGVRREPTVALRFSRYIALNLFATSATGDMIVVEPGEALLSSLPSDADRTASGLRIGLTTLAAASFLKRRVNALLACSNGLTGLFDWFRELVRSIPFKNAARFFTDCSGMSSLAAALELGALLQLDRSDERRESPFSKSILLVDLSRSDVFR
jgi:hypothetical protein